MLLLLVEIMVLYCAEGDEILDRFIVSISSSFITAASVAFLLPLLDKLNQEANMLLFFYALLLV